MGNNKTVIFVMISQKSKIDKTKSLKKEIEEVFKIEPQLLPEMKL